MSRIVSNLILSLAMVPLACAVAFVSGSLLTDRLYSWDDYGLVVSISIMVAMVFVYPYWFAVWRSTVRWTPRRTLQTLLGVAGSLGVGALVLLAMRASIRRTVAGSHAFADVAWPTFCGALVAGLLWIVYTMIIWRETPAEKAERLRTAAGGGGGYIGPLLCPMCGYDMRGLNHARCPECGTEYTLDALLTANVDGIDPQRETAAGD